MTVWKSFGASVIGPGHIATGKPNQDAWSSFHRVWGDGIAVSDGLGSRPLSNFGSDAACFAVVCAARTCRGNEDANQSLLAERIKNKWLSLIAPLEPGDCAATCLFAFRTDQGAVRMGMLGDGLVAVLKNDGSVVSLCDDKTDGFSNITAALTPNVTVRDWRLLSIPEDDCKSVILCTDGVADDLEDMDGFVREFDGAHHDLAAVSAARRARWMLEDWPVPKHTDDKTMACLFREEVADA